MLLLSPDIILTALCCTFSRQFLSPSVHLNLMRQSFYRRKIPDPNISLSLLKARHNLASSISISWDSPFTGEKYLIPTSRCPCWRQDISWLHPSQSHEIVLLQEKKNLIPTSRCPSWRQDITWLHPSQSHEIVLLQEKNTWSQHLAVPTEGKAEHGVIHLNVMKQSFYSRKIPDPNISLSLLKARHRTASSILISWDCPFTVEKYLTPTSHCPCWKPGTARRLPS